MGDGLGQCNLVPLLYGKNMQYTLERWKAYIITIHGRWDIILWASLSPMVRIKLGFSHIYDYDAMV